MICRQGNIIYKAIQRMQSDIRGMTLIDMAIALMVLGLLLAPLAQAYNRKQLNDTTGATDSNMSAVYKAISDFYFEQDRYPCPALPNLGPGDAAFGQEDCDATAAAQGVASDGTATGTLAGAVPFKALKIPFENTLDGYENKISYVVTRTLASPDSFPINPGGGAIITDEVPQLPPNFVCAPAVGPRDNEHSFVHLLLISHGPEGEGAYSATGNLLSTCRTGGGAYRDSTNCNFTADAVYLLPTCVTNYNDGPEYYDDEIRSFSALPQRIWALNAIDQNDIFSDRSNVNEIGINTDDPQTALHVVGNIRTNGVAESSEICNAAGDECMSPLLVAGDDPAMACGGTDSSTAASGIRNGEVECSVGFLPNYASKSCAAGKYMIGLDSGGNIICSP